MRIPAIHPAGVAPARHARPLAIAGRHPALHAFLALSAVYLLGDPHGLAAQPVELNRAMRLPFPATLESVLERGAIEGYPVTVLRVRSPLGAEEAVAAARSAWSAAESPAVVVTRSAAWRIVSVREPGGYRTLQLRASPGGGSEGLLSVWSGDSPAAPARRGDVDLVRLLPAGARVLRRLQGTDSGRGHQTLVALVHGSVRWVAGALHGRVLAHGWRPEPFAHRADASQARTYRADGRELGITVHEHRDQAAVVIHLTEVDR